MRWLTVAARLNPHDPYIPLHHGWCLDWLGRPGEAQAYLDPASLLGPNGYFTAAPSGRPPPSPVRCGVEGGADRLLIEDRFASGRAERRDLI